jgi:hypothetical protein
MWAYSILNKRLPEMIFCTFYQRSPNHHLPDHYLSGHLKNNTYHQPNFCTKEDLCPKIIHHIDGIHAVSDLAIEVIS